MKRIGIIGFGAMGKVHLKNYAKIEDADVVAICDISKDKLNASDEGNIKTAGRIPDLTGIDIYSDSDRMFEEAELDAVSITLPTSMHREYTLKAFGAGLDVLCEKPMALTSAECREMIDAAEKGGRVLQIGHCIRFWPEYVKARELARSGKYGRVKAVMLRRLSLSPGYSWENWLLNASRSGGVLMDLHVHDSDFVQYLLGMPAAVCTRAIKSNDCYVHGVTQYIYDDEVVITAECCWIMTASFGFEMSFDMVLEKAVIRYNSMQKPTIMVYPDSGEPFSPDIEAGDGYLFELRHFIETVSGRSVPEIITPEQSLRTIELVEAELESADSGGKAAVVQGGIA